MNSVTTDRGPGGPVVRVIVLRLNCVTEPRVTTSLTWRQITDPHTHMYTYIQTYIHIYTHTHTHVTHAQGVGMQPPKYQKFQLFGRVIAGVNPLNDFKFFLGTFICQSILH